MVSQEHVGSQFDTVIAHETNQYGHLLTATLGGRLVSSLSIDPNGRVVGVNTDREFERRGLASRLWREAKERGLQPHHAPDNQTRQGRAWAKKVGD